MCLVCPGEGRGCSVSWDFTSSSARLPTDHITSGMESRSHQDRALACGLFTAPWTKPLGSEAQFHNDHTSGRGDQPSNLLNCPWLHRICCSVISIAHFTAAQAEALRKKGDSLPQYKGIVGVWGWLCSKLRLPDSGPLIHGTIFSAMYHSYNFSRKIRSRCCCRVHFLSTWLRSKKTSVIPHASHTRKPKLQVATWLSGTLHLSSVV